MRRTHGAAAILAAAVLASAAGCGESDNARRQTPNDQPIGAPSKAGQPAPGGQPGGPAPVKGRGAPLPK